MDAALGRKEGKEGGGLEADLTTAMNGAATAMNEEAAKHQKRRRASNLQDLRAKRNNRSIRQSPNIDDDNDETKEADNGDPPKKQRGKAGKPLASSSFFPLRPSSALFSGGNRDHCHQHHRRPRRRRQHLGLIARALALALAAAAAGVAGAARGKGRERGGAAGAAGAEGASSSSSSSYCPDPVSQGQG